MRNENEKEVMPEPDITISFTRDELRDLKGSLWDAEKICSPDDYQRNHNILCRDMARLLVRCFEKQLKSEAEELDD